MAMLSLNCAILCRGMWARDALNDALFCKMLAKCLEFTSPIRLEVDNFLIELSLYTMLKVNKNLKTLFFSFKGYN